MSLWTRPELLLTLNLYFETPFGKQHKTHPPIVELAKVLGRTPSAIAMKMSNFTSLDPAEIKRGTSGLSGASKLDREIWLEFETDTEMLVEEIELFLEQQRNEKNTISGLTQNHEYTGKKPKEPTTIVGLTKQRRHQNIFRRLVLGTYGCKCCITDNPIPELLRASHIIPWSASEKHRLNPRNGLCLSATLDAAFDRGLIAFSDEFSLMLSPKLILFEQCPEIQQVFITRNGMQIELPEKNSPDPKFLKWHRDNVFAE